MLVARTGFAGVPWAGGKLYIFGGTNFTSNLADSEVYDPAANTWTEIAALPRANSFMGAATGSDLRIYVIGGWDGHAAVNWVQAYDPRTNTWSCSFVAPGCASSSLAPLPTPRASLAVVPVGGGHVIFALGGLTTRAVTTDEGYSPKFNVWFAGSPLRHAASGLAAAFIPPVLPNAANARYTSHARSDAPQAGNGSLIAYGGNSGNTFNNEFDVKAIPEQPNLDPFPDPALPDIFPDPNQEPFPVDFPDPPLTLPEFPDADPFDQLPDPPPFPEADFDPTASDPLWSESMVVDPFSAFQQSVVTRHARPHATSSVSPLGTIYVIGAETGPSDPVHVYSRASGSWSAGQSLATARVNSWAVLTRSRMLYVLGGNDAFDHVYGQVDALRLPGNPATPTSAPVPTPRPSSAPVPASTPTLLPIATPSPSSTPPVEATLQPLTLSIQLGHASVKVGKKQTVTVTTASTAHVSIVVGFPKGRKLHHAGTSENSGTFQWTFKQPRGRTKGSHHTARVTVSVNLLNGPGSLSATKTYTIV